MAERGQATLWVGGIPQAHATEAAVREAVRQAVGPELAEFAISSFGLEGDPNFESESWVLRRDDDPLKLSRERGVDSR